MNIAPHKIRKADGFTIMEMTIVLIIIGVLAALTFPGYRIQTMKIRNQEAVRVLMSIWEAQKDYYRINNVYTNDIDDLDVEIPALRNFNGPFVIDGTPDSCSGPATPVLASAVSMDGYTLYVLEDGRIVCDPCADTRCAQMGFPGW